MILKFNSQRSKSIQRLNRQTIIQKMWQHSIVSGSRLAQTHHRTRMMMILPIFSRANCVCEQCTANVCALRTTALHGAAKQHQREPDET